MGLPASSISHILVWSVVFQGMLLATTIDDMKEVRHKITARLASLSSKQKRTKFPKNKIVDVSFLLKFGLVKEDIENVDHGHAGAGIIKLDEVPETAPEPNPEPESKSEEVSQNPSSTSIPHNFHPYAEVSHFHMKRVKRGLFGRLRVRARKGFGKSGRRRRKRRRKHKQHQHHVSVDVVLGKGSGRGGYGDRNEYWGQYGEGYGGRDEYRGEYGGGYVNRNEYRQQYGGGYGDRNEHWGQYGGGYGDRNEHRGQYGGGVGRPWRRWRRGAGRLV